MRPAWLGHVLSATLSVAATLLIVQFLLLPQWLGPGADRAARPTRALPERASPEQQFQAANGPVNTAAETGIRHAFAALPDNFRLAEVQCQASRCRVRYTLPPTANEKPGWPQPDFDALHFQLAEELESGFIVRHGTESDDIRTLYIALP